MKLGTLSEMPDVSTRQEGAPPKTFANGLLPALAAFTALAIVLQIASGAYRAEFAVYSDEPAHLVSGIALSAYIHGGLSHGPLAFLENYYLHYPKVGIGHWPPLLYLIECAAFLIAPWRATFLVIQAAFAGLLAVIVFRLLRPLVGAIPAAAAAAAMLCLPGLQSLTSMAMAEVLLTLTMFLACLAFARFVETKSTADSIWFGIWTSAAILTKGTGWALVILPPVVLLFTRRWNLLLRWKTWIPAAIVAALALPWQFATARIAAAGWNADVFDWSYKLTAFGGLAKMMFLACGGVVMPLALLAIVIQALWPAWKGRAKPLPSSLAAFVFAVWIFHVLVPAGIEQRKMIIALPALFVLAGFGAVHAAKWTPRLSQRWVAGALFLAVALWTAVKSLPPGVKPEYGAIQAARILNSLVPSDSAVLVSADAFGEGAFIAEFALLEPTPTRYIVRASKLLSTSGWSNGYRALARTPEECRRLLESVPISFVAIDLRPKVTDEDHRVLLDMLTHSNDWRLVGEYAMSGGKPPSMAVWARRGSPRVVADLSIDLQSTFGHDKQARHGIPAAIVYTGGALRDVGQ